MDYLPTRSEPGFEAIDPALTSSGCTSGICQAASEQHREILRECITQIKMATGRMREQQPPSGERPCSHVAAVATIQSFADTAATEIEAALARMEAAIKGDLHTVRGPKPPPPPDASAMLGVLPSMPRESGRLGAPATQPFNTGNSRSMSSSSLMAGTPTKITHPMAHFHFHPSTGDSDQYGRPNIQTSGGFSRSSAPYPDDDTQHMDTQPT